MNNGKRPRNPLSRRVWKDIIRDRKRYIMIFLMLVVTIGYVSGMYVANNSMITTMSEKKFSLNVEDGNFELTETLDTASVKAVESGEKADIVTVFRNRAYNEAEEEIIKKADENILEKVKEQVKTAIRSNVEKEVDKKLAPLSAVNGSGVPNDVRKKTIDEAFEKAMENSYEKTVDEAFDKAKNSDDYKNTISDLLMEAKKEIDKKIDDEYVELSERYGLDDKDFKPAPVKLYSMFCRESSEEFDGKIIGTIRVYGERKDIDLYDILEGKSPENENEIIIDRMHADNVGVKVGDTIKINSAEFKVTGLAAFVDYSSLYKSNSDTMFDAITFDVGMTTNKGFDRINGDILYKYAFKFNESPTNPYEEKTFSDNFLKALITQGVFPICLRYNCRNNYLPFDKANYRKK